MISIRGADKNFDPDGRVSLPSQNKHFADKAFIVTIKASTWELHTHYWPLPGVGQFILPLFSSIVASTIKISDLRLVGMTALSEVGGLLETEDRKFLKDAKSLSTFLLRPGDVLWLPAGTVPLATGWQEKDDAPEKSTCLVIPFFQKKEALSKVTSDDKTDIKQFIEIILHDNKTSLTWSGSEPTITQWIADAFA